METHGAPLRFVKGFKAAMASDQSYTRKVAVRRVRDGIVRPFCREAARHAAFWGRSGLAREQRPELSGRKKKFLCSPIEVSPDGYIADLSNLATDSRS